MIRPSTKIGERRLVRRFALLPVRTDDGFDIWLRWYWKKQRWGTYTYNMEGDFCYTWVTTDYYAHKPEEQP